MHHPGAAHRVFVDQPLAGPGSVVALVDDEAHHAQNVKRIRIGDQVQVHDGAGGVAMSLVESLSPAQRKQPGNVLLRLTDVRHEPRPAPEVIICSPAPKGGRLEDMIDQLSQCGACEWRTLAAQRAVVEPSERRGERVQRVCIESLKQSGRAWLLRATLTPMSFDEALSPAPGTRVLIADATGLPIGPALAAQASDRGGGTVTSVRVLIGPEGGWTDDERGRALAAGAIGVALGPNIMRLETACVAAAVLVRGVFSASRASAGTDSG